MAVEKKASLAAKNTLSVATFNLRLSVQMLMGSVALHFEVFWSLDLL